MIHPNASTARFRRMHCAAHRLFFSLIVIQFSAGLACAADVTFNISYIAESDPLSGGLVYGDVWAEGGYAYVGSDVNGGGMSIFSLSNSGIPTYLATYAGDQMEDVEVWDGIGYFGSDTNTSTGTGVDIVDLSIPFEPVMLSRVNGTIGGHNKVHTLSVSEGHLYTADNATDVVKIFNVANPANPQLVKSLDLGLGPTTNPTTNIASHEVIVRNDRLYVASKDNNFNTCCGWTSIYDVTNPANPVLLKKFESGPRSHTSLPSADGKILIVAEERPNGNVNIYDISMINSPNDPDAPLLLSVLNRGDVGIDAHSPHHPHLHGNLLFLPWYEAGLQVFNIVDPANPIHAGAFDTYPGTSTNYNGNWGVDLSLGLDTVLLSDRSRGLIVVDASDVLAPGDYNQDMVVDPDDYFDWRGAFGTGDSGLHTGAFADGNNDGAVNAADYVVWRDHLGQTGPTGSGAASFSGESTVPEPATFILVGIGLIFSLCRVRTYLSILYAADTELSALYFRRDSRE